MTGIAGNALVAHGGGPTAVLNASLAGIVQECRTRGVGRLYGARNGAEGILSANFADLLAQDSDFWEQAALAPGSVLGTSRRKVSEQDFDAMIGIFRRHDIRFVFITGGNGSMGMALGLVNAARSSGYEVAIIGVPKTIDNDLTCTDHSPGYASAARFFAYALRDIGADNRALGGITVVEVLGRNTGWLAAATVLARSQPDDAPHLIYMPERTLPFHQLAADADRVYSKRGRAVIAVCEGQLDEEAKPFGADTRMSSRAPLALNLAHVLAQRLTQALGVSARSEKPGLLGRSCSALVSEVDRAEALACGRAAVRAALEGTTGRMITLERVGGLPYQSRTATADLGGIAWQERLFPLEWLAERPDDDMPQFRTWLEPITGPITALPILR